jgi:hypothetical protein
MRDYDQVVGEYEREATANAVMTLCTAVFNVLLVFCIVQPPSVLWLLTGLVGLVAGAAACEVIRIRFARSDRIDRLLKEGRIRKVG